MFSKSLLLIAAACLSAALASCGSGSGAIPGSEGGAPDQDPPADELSEAKRRADASMAAAAAAPSLTTINAARVAADAYVKAAAAAARSADGSNRQAAAQSALRAAQSERDANRRRLNELQASLGERAGPDGGAEPGGSAGSLSLAQRLANLRSRSLTSLERGHNYRRRGGGATFILNGFRCSESTGTCGLGGLQQGGNAYLNPAFFFVDLATPFTAAPINGVDAFSEYDNHDDPDEEDYSRSWKLLALGQFSAARMDTLRTLDRTGTSLATTDSYGVALGERHGRPGGASGSATWRGQMVGAALDNGGPLAGEAALTYSFSADTVDVQMSNIRAVGDVAPYSGSASFTWSGLAVNSDGSFYIAGYNNDRSEATTLATALHPTLGYIDGDFYGPNAEEAAGIFTRGNVNGAWLAKSIGPLTSVDDRPTPSDGGSAPSEEDGTPSDGEPTAQGGGAGSLSLAQRLANLRSRTLTSLERGHNYRRNVGGATFFLNAFRCSESAGTCGVGVQYGGNSYLNPAFFHVDSATPFTAAPVNGVDAFSEYDNHDDPDEEDYSRSWKLLALGQFSAARMDTLRTLDRTGTSLATTDSYGVALGERHGRPGGASGSATWRGQMVGAALDNGGPLAGEAALTYSFSANTVDVQMSNIRAVGDVAPYSGSTSFTWSGLAVNSDGSFHIAGYNNDRSGLTYSTALHPTLGYIDGDFYGPNAEEVAGIFTRDNVNGAWLAKK